MKKIATSLILLILIFSQSPVFSEVYWTLIDTTKTEKWYVDIESIEKDANYIEYWVKIGYKKQKNQTKYLYVFMVSECYRNLLSVGEMIRYKTNSEFIEHHSSKNMIQFTPVIPETSLSKVHNLACKSATFRY